MSKKKNVLSCRIDDFESPEILVSAFGEVETPLQQGFYEPGKDTYVSDSGRQISSYYKKRLGIPFFKPIDKSVFKTPPTGWLTWMYYGREMTPQEILVNAKWISENLREYGVNVILLDDGWQADGRNWEGLRNTFPRGMKWMADEIRKLGLEPGLWLCPHGQDNDTFTKDTGGFIKIDTFGGPFTVDPTDPKGIKYIQKLMRRITCEWGYSFLKFDGISGKSGYGVLAGYRENQKLFADPSISAEDAYRRFFGAIMDSVGKKVFIDACSVGVCPEVIGLCNGKRTGADTDSEWGGFIRAVTATMNGYFLHNIATYTDPDCCLLRLPLSMDMAKAWATLYGLTGQMLMFDDRMPDLSPSRIGILKKISPAADIRPFDIFPSSKHKSIFDLKINHLGRKYDVVAIFNYEETMQRVAHLDFKLSGLDPECRYHAYDFWNEDYLGVYDAGLFIEVPPAACRAITLVKEDNFPVLLSTSRHIMQGWPDLEKFSIERRSSSIKGESKMIKGEKYTLTFGLPNDGKKAYVLDSVELDGKELPAICQGRGSASVSWTPCESGVTKWKANFKKITMPLPTSIGSYPYMIGSKDIDPWTVEIFWVSFGSPAGFYVKQNGKLIGYTFNTRFRVGNLKYGSKHEFEVGVADLDGRKGQHTGKISIVVGETLPSEMYLSDLEWTSVSSGYLTSRQDKAVGGAGLSCSGKRYAKGIGTHPSSRIVYDLKGIFTRLTGLIGIEDQNGCPKEKTHEESGQACFSIRGDGRELLKSTHMIHGQAPKPIDFDIRGVKCLELVVERPLNVKTNFAPHSNWLDMKILL